MGRPSTCDCNLPGCMTCYHRRYSKSHYVPRIREKKFCGGGPERKRQKMTDGDRALFEKYKEMFGGD